MASRSRNNNLLIGATEPVPEQVGRFDCRRVQLDDKNHNNGGYRDRRSGGTRDGWINCHRDM